MPESSNMSAAPGSDEKTEVLPETAVQLVELERLRNELAAAEIVEWLAKRHELIPPA